MTVFEYENFRDYLHDLLKQETAKGVSLRSLASRCQFSSPNYLQQLLRGKTKVTRESARRIANGTGLSISERLYLYKLVDLEDADQDELEILRTELRVAAGIHRSKVDEPIFYELWLPSFILALAQLTDAPLTVEGVHASLPVSVPDDIVADAIALLRERAWLTLDDHSHHVIPKRSFGIFGELKSLEFRDCQKFCLQQALSRIQTDRSLCEYQGFTVPVASQAMPELRRRIRRALESLRWRVESDGPTDTIMRFQFAAFPFFPRKRE